MVRKRRQYSNREGLQRGVSQRRLRVGEELRHLLSEIFRQGGCRDPALRDVSIAVTEVRFSSDLRNATVFVMPLGGANATEIFAGLKRSTPYLKRLVAGEVTLRYAPDLRFELDVSFDHAARIAALLAQPEVERDLRLGATLAENHDDAG